MSQNIDVGIGIDKELEIIEEGIEKYNKLLDDLIWQRSELLVKKQDLEVYELVDCIVEKGISLNEALEILNSVDYIKRNLIRS